MALGDLSVKRLADYAVIFCGDIGEGSDDDTIIRGVLEYAETTVNCYQTGAPGEVRIMAVLRLASYILQRDQTLLRTGGRSNVFSLSGARGMLKPYANRRAVVI